MTHRALFFSILSAVLLTACAAQPDPPAAGEAADPAAPPAAQTAAQTEAEAEQRLEKKFQEAAKGYKVVEREGRTLYCKREKVLGSTIPTMQCLSEAQLRLQVENMEELRGRMRNSAKCTMGRSGGGGGACGGSCAFEIERRARGPPLLHLQA